jgi:hypothetical protein
MGMRPPGRVIATVKAAGISAVKRSVIPSVTLPAISARAPTGREGWADVGPVADVLMGMRPPGRVLRTGDTAGESRSDGSGAKWAAMGAVSGEMDGDSAGDSACCPTALVHRANLARIPMTELARILAGGTCPTPHWRRFGRLDTASVHIAKCPHVHVSTCPSVHVSTCSSVHVSRWPSVHMSTLSERPAASVTSQRSESQRSEVRNSECDF